MQAAQMAPPACRSECRHSQAGAPVSSSLPPRVWDELSQALPLREARYVAAILTAEELSVLAELKDAIIIARIKRMPHARLRRFDCFFPHSKEDQDLYRKTQLRWLRDEEYLLGTRLGRSPKAREITHDFNVLQLGLRFRAYFAMKFPDRVVRKRG